MATSQLRWQQRFANYRKDVRGSRDAIRRALQINLIDDRRWLETIEDRNLTMHNYDNEVATEINENIMHIYCPLFVAFGQKMQSLVEPTLFDQPMYGMTDEELDLLCSLFARQKEIEQVILYGSRAKGTHKPFSDVDITLLGIGLSRSHLNRLSAEIDESSLPYFFDISIFSKLTSPALIEQIEKTGVVLYRRGES